MVSIDLIVFNHYVSVDFCFLPFFNFLIQLTMLLMVMCAFSLLFYFFPSVQVKHVLATMEDDAVLLMDYYYFFSCCLHMGFSLHKDITDTSVN